ncbi:MAG: DUF3606 domain-containing protein [Pseudoxanthomonas sp.]
MLESLPQEAPPDASAISLLEQQHVQYWTTRLGVSRNQLSLAIEAVGPWPAQVEAWLRHQGQLVG